MVSTETGSEQARNTTRAKNTKKKSPFEREKENIASEEQQRGEALLSFDNRREKSFIRSASDESIHSTKESGKVRTGKTSIE